MWIEVTGGRLHISHEGAGPPLLLMHGWTLDQRMFKLQIPRLREYFHVISYDRRGFGRSMAPPDLDLELDDIDKIADALSLDTMHLLGMSQGGRIALRYAVTRSQRLRSLILQGTVVDGLDIDGTDNERIPLAEYADLVRAGKLEEMRQRWLRHPVLALGPGHDKEQQLINEILDNYTGSDLLSFSADKLTTSLDVPGKLVRFQAPTLLLTGATETGRLKLHAQRLLEIIPNCREIIFDDSGHLCNLTEAELYNEHVIRFCSAIDKMALSP